MTPWDNDKQLFGWLYQDLRSHRPEFKINSDNERQKGWKLGRGRVSRGSGKTALVALHGE